MGDCLDTLDELDGDPDDLKLWQKCWCCFFCIDKILCREACKKFDEKDFDSDNDHDATKNSKGGMNCCQTLGLGMCCFLFWPVLIPLSIFYAICRMLNYFCCGKSCFQNNIFVKMVSGIVVIPSVNLHVHVTVV